jgi:hypothetical protein
MVLRVAPVSFWVKGGTVSKMSLSFFESSQRLTI